MKPGNPAAGFTLAEMLIVMAILGVIAAISAPSFRDFALRRTISAQVSELGSALRLARSEALKRGREVSLCPTSNPNAVKPGCAGGNDWGKGYIVFIGSVYNNDQYIRVQQPYGNSGKILGNYNGAIRFRGNGVLKEGGVRRFEFQPALPRNDSSFARLRRTMCLNPSGVLLPC